eukprot:CAMPEP_0178513734 /NCGR_PEP_ID=MMETSP0696-20121128/23638_1 /TAXON_ID=265572 /ORGANISM="Extubocellulus spinifer, Strain CCMP396" /LENGTH=326 /DNA_ID=CAMNT_0020143763 /DNA_START=115 /DNA_END=1095 /DNA_ORIENTATION=-
MNIHNHQNAVVGATSVSDPSSIEPLDSSVDFLTDFADGFHSDALFLCNILESSSRRDATRMSQEQLDYQPDRPMSAEDTWTTNAAGATEPETPLMPPASVPMLSSGHLSATRSAPPRSSAHTSAASTMKLAMPKITPMSVTSTGTMSTSTTGTSSVINENSRATSGPKFRAFHEKKWDERLLELRAFRKEHGHSLVPHTYPSNPQLARWVKRQRRQHKLLQEGKASTMTPDRAKLLESLGFVWDSHNAAWTEKTHDLRQYRAKYGDCLVPSAFKPNPQLATWVKCQRRQYKLYWEGKPSAMTPQRIAELEEMGFVWELRSSARRTK